MWDGQQSASTRAGRPAIWAIWSEVERWNEWNSGVKWARRDGPFAAGTRGKLKPSRGPSSSFQLTEVDPERRWVISTQLPGAELQIEHLLTDAPEGGLTITYRGRLSGPLAPVLARLMSKPLEGSIAAVHELAAYAGRT
jgi:hypothetical protein